MFASQLLRILQTLPADANYDPCAFDTAELKVRMKETENGALRHTDDYCKSITSKDLRHSNGDGKATDPSEFQTGDTNDFWNTTVLERSAVVNEFTEDAKPGIRVSPPKDDRSEVLHNLSGIKKDRADTLISDRKDGENLWNTPEFECPTIIDDHSIHNKPETQVSGAPFIASSELFQDSNLYTDKNVLECDLPELMVCYKEINYHVVKDICVDEGMKAEDKDLIDRHTDDSAGAFVSLSSTDYGPIKTQASPDFKMLIPDGLKASPGAVVGDSTTDKWGANDKGNAVSPALSMSKCLPAGRVNKKGQNPEVFTHVAEANADTKIKNDVMLEESIVTSALPLNNFGTRSFLRSFMDSFDKHGDGITQQSNQSVKANLESPDAESGSENLNQKDAGNEVVISSKVDNGTITFDFSSEPIASETSLKTEDELNHNDPLGGSVVLGERHQESVLDHDYRISSNPFISSEVQSACTDGNILQETEVNNNSGRSSNPFTVLEVQSGSVDGSTEEILPTDILNHKKGNFNPFAISEIEAASTDEDSEDVHQASVVNTKVEKSNNPFVVCEDAVVDEGSEIIHQQPVPSNKIAQTNNPFADTEVAGIQNSDQQPEVKHKDGKTTNPFAVSDVQSAGMDETLRDQSVEPKGLPNLGGTLKAVSLTDQGDGADGEASFSAESGRITYSGPISCSGSTSLRSDSSATSTRSFAFPVLQAEWNSSPVRMGKAERRHFRKQRGGWKQGIFCCRF